MKRDFSILHRNKKAYCLFDGWIKLLRDFQIIQLNLVPKIYLQNKMNRNSSTTHSGIRDMMFKSKKYISMLLLLLLFSFQ